ncbi:Protein LIFEGUARD 2 [Linum perenne]
MMMESPELRWAFIRKIYAIISIQLLATIAVAATVVNVISSSSFVVAISSVAVLCPLYFYHQKHPVNYILLAIFTIAIAFSVGVTCAFTSGKKILVSQFQKMLFTDCCLRLFYVN